MKTRIRIKKRAVIEAVLDDKGVVTWIGMYDAFLVCVYACVCLCVCVGSIKTHRWRKKNEKKERLKI